MPAQHARMPLHSLRHRLACRVFALIRLLLAAGLLASLNACVSSTIPTAESLDALAAQVRRQEQPRFDDLEQRRASGQLSEQDYLTENAALEKHVNERASEIAWTRHSLDQSYRKAHNLPTPDNPIELIAPNAMQGSGVGGSLYRPATQQAQGAWNNGMGGGMGAGIPQF